MDIQVNKLIIWEKKLMFKNNTLLISTNIPLTPLLLLIYRGMVGGDITVPKQPQGSVLGWKSGHMEKWSNHSVMSGTDQYIGQQHQAKCSDKYTDELQMSCQYTFWNKVPVPLHLHFDFCEALMKTPKFEWNTVETV